MERRYPTEHEILEDVEADINVPWLYSWTKISHYYGDSVRGLLIAGAVLMLVTAPFYADNLDVQLPFIVLGAVVAVCVAGLTSPWRRGVISADAVVAGVVLIIFQIWALQRFQTDPVHQFVLREAVALVFLFALYFSTKTLRSMLLNQLGRSDSPGDFAGGRVKPAEVLDEKADWNRRAHAALKELNEHEKLDFND